MNVTSIDAPAQLDPATALAGTMMGVPLELNWLFEHAVRNHARAQIVSLLDDGSTYRYTYLDFAHRVAQLAHALELLRAARAWKLLDEDGRREMVRA